MEIKTVLISDINGTAGMQCMQVFLDRGYRVKALFSGSHPEVGQVVWIEADVLDPESYFQELSDVQLVVHNASLFSLRMADRAKLKAINMQATRDLVNNALISGVSELIYLSSAYTLVRSGEPQVISTTSIGNPVFLNYWTETLFQGELEVQRAAAEGMKVCILNSALVMDPFENKLNPYAHLLKTLSSLPKLFCQNVPYITAETLALHILKVPDLQLWSGQFLANSESMDLRLLFDGSSGVATQPTSTRLPFLSNYFPVRLKIKLNELLNCEDRWLNKETLQLFGPAFLWVQTVREKEIFCSASLQGKSF